MEHIKETAGAVGRYIDRGLSVCVVNPCGSGKSLVMSEIIRSHPGRTFLILSKQKNAGPYFKSLSPVFSQETVTITTYAKMNLDVESGDISGYRADYYLLDEAHYLGAVHWGASFRKLADTYDPVCIGFTATPQRYGDQGTEKTIVTEYFDGRSAGNFTSRSLQEQGVFTEPEYVLGIRDFNEAAARKYLEVEDSELSERDKAAVWQKLQKLVASWKKNSSPEVILGRHLPAYMYRDSCNRILVYTKDVASTERDRKWLGTILRGIFPGKRVEEYTYTFKDPEENLRKFMAEDEGTYIKVLYSVNKVTETVHIDDLKVIIMLRPSGSGRVITQQVGRINNIRDKRRPLIVDFVSNLERLRTINSTICAHGSLSFRKRTGSGTEEDRRTPSRHLYADEYGDVFREIDRALQKRTYYSCMGFTGTLRDICYVFGRDSQAVEAALILTDDIEKAIRAVPRKICKSYRPKPPAARLSETGSAYVEKNMYIAEDYIRRHGIADSDIRQEIYEEYFNAASQMQEGPEEGFHAGEIQNRIRTRYLQICRARQQKKELVTGMESVASAIAADDPEEKALNRCLKDDLLEIMSTLTEREQEVLSMRYGLGGRPDMTLKEAGNALGITMERVRQIEAKALRKLRHPSRSRKLKDYLS